MLNPAAKGHTVRVTASCGVELRAGVNLTE
jgi:hypothetical protein